MSTHAAATQSLSPNALLKLRQIIGDPQHNVPGLFPVGKTQLYNLIKRGDFPPPMKIGSSSFWKYSDVLAVIAKLDAGSAK